MSLTLTFLGAARNVTGSRYLLEDEGDRVLVDCGLYQERELQGRNWEAFPVPPASIRTVILTHAHLDHCGYLPRLVRDGFRGQVVCTPATAEIARIVLFDSAKIQVEDASFKKKRHRRERRTGPHPAEPLYSPEDVQTALTLFAPVEYGVPTPLAGGFTAEFLDAGHILGSASVRITAGEGPKRRTVLFSGDMGRPNKPMLNDPVPAAAADYLVMESTYGDRVHEGADQIQGRLAEAIIATRRAGGNLIVPSFAIERAQEVLYHLNELLIEGGIPHLLVFVDSPMAVSVTEVFERHPELFDREMNAHLRRRHSPFSFRGLRMVRRVEESKAINNISGTVMIIAGSGMCTGGRIKHHLVANISRPESTILFVGYQAVGTLGRQILDGRPEVRIHGEMRRLRARVTNIPGFSAHADRDEMLNWLAAVTPAPRRVFVTHGEADSAQAFAALLDKRRGWSTSVPEYRESFALD